MKSLAVSAILKTDKTVDMPAYKVRGYKYGPVGKTSGKVTPIRPLLQSMVVGRDPNNADESCFVLGYN